MQTSSSTAAEIVETPTWLAFLVRTLVFLYPVSAATLGWGSEILMLLLLPALFYCRGWSQLETWERRLLLGFVALFVVMSFSLLNAEELREGVKALDRYLRFALLLPIYLMFRRFGFTLGTELAMGAVVGVVLMLAQGIYQVQWQGMYQAEGYYHKIVFGDLAVWWAAVIALFMVTRASGWWFRLALLAAIFIGIYAALLSQTRGAWLFIPLFPLILLVAQWGRARRMRKWVKAALLVAATLLVVIASQSEQLRGGIQRGVDELESFTKKPEAYSSWGIRLNLWRNSLLLLQETPLLGTGVGDFKSDMRRMVEDGRSWNPHVQQFSHAHSIYFDALAKGGLLGFVTMTLALLLMPFAIFVRALRRAEPSWERFYALGGVLLIAAFATFGVSEGLWTRNPFVNTYIICLLVFMTGMVNSRNRAAAEVDKRL